MTKNEHRVWLFLKKSKTTKSFAEIHAAMNHTTGQMSKGTLTGCLESLAEKKCIRKPSARGGWEMIRDDET